MNKGGVLVSVVVAARECDVAPAMQSAAAQAAISPLGCLSLDRQAVAANSAGDVPQPLGEQLTTIQTFYQEHRCEGDGTASALFDIQLGDTGPTNEVLGYYEGVRGESTTSAAPTAPAASLFSCAEIVHIQDPPPIVHSSRRDGADGARGLHSRQMGHRWDSVFKAPLTIFDDRFGATNFWRCFQQILYKGAFGFEAIEGERYGIQMQGIAVPVVEFDALHDSESDDGAAENGDGEPSSETAAAGTAAKFLRRSSERHRPTRAEGKSFDLFHFYSNVQPQAHSSTDDGDVHDTRAKKLKAAKCHLSDAQDLRDVARYLESFLGRIEEQEGPAHMILYITFVDVNDPRNRRSLCLVRLDDVALDESLAAGEFRVAEVLEMLVEELALASSAGAAAKEVFNEDEGVQLATECSRLTMILRKVLHRNYERFEQHTSAAGSDFVTQTHWLLNLPEGEFVPGTDDHAVIRVQYADPTVAERVAQAMETMVQLQEVNMECAMPKPPLEQRRQDKGPDEEENSFHVSGKAPEAAPHEVDPTCSSRPSPTDILIGSESAGRRRRSVVHSCRVNTAVADSSPFAFDATNDLDAGAALSPLVISETMWEGAIVSGGTRNRTPLSGVDGTFRESVSVAGRHTKLPSCRLRTCATVFAEATPATLDLPVSPREQAVKDLTSVFHVQMGVPPSVLRGRGSVASIGHLFHRNRVKRHQRREQMTFTLI